MSEQGNVESEQAEAEAIEPIVECNVPPPMVKARPRNYSFLHKNPDHFDEIECDGKKFSIPAHIGSTYWAILKVHYEHFGQPIYESNLPALVEQLMLDRDAEAWEAYKSKSHTTVYHKGEKRRLVKPAKSWQERVINNAKTLTRKGGNSPYGKRLHERGHALVYGHDAKHQPHFTLSAIAEKAEKVDKQM